jgi:hypothetical protein
LVLEWCNGQWDENPNGLANEIMSLVWLHSFPLKARLRAGFFMPKEFYHPSSLPLKLLQIDNGLKDYSYIYL